MLGFVNRYAFNVFNVINLVCFAIKKIPDYDWCYAILCNVKRFEQKHSSAHTCKRFHDLSVKYNLYDNCISLITSNHYLIDTDTTI